MVGSLGFLCFLVIWGHASAQYFNSADFSSGCTIPSDNYNGQPIVLPPFLCNAMLRESARALGYIEPFVPAQMNNQLMPAGRELMPAARVLINCNQPATAARAVECIKMQAPVLQTARAIDCNQQQLYPTARAIECYQPQNAPIQAARAVTDCRVVPNAPECYPQQQLILQPIQVQPMPQQMPASRGLDCVQVPIPAARFVGCDPNVVYLQEAERAIQAPPTTPPCPAQCATLCAGCQNNNGGQNTLGQEEAMVEMNQAGRAVAGPQYSYNLIPVKLRSKTPGTEDQMSHLLLLQLKPESKKSESEDPSRNNDAQRASVVSRSLK